MKAHLRVARPTDNLRQVADMYREGLGFEVLGTFEDHDGFDGVILGAPGAEYHLEFTHHGGRTVGKAPTEDHLLVFYLPDSQEWSNACDRMLRAGFRQVPDGIRAMIAKTYPGKIVVFPLVADFPLTALSDLKQVLPEVYNKLGSGGAWTGEAEAAFLEATLPGSEAHGG